MSSNTECSIPKTSKNPKNNGGWPLGEVNSAPNEVIRAFLSIVLLSDDNNNGFNNKNSKRKLSTPLPFWSKNNIIIITPERNEYPYQLSDFSDDSYTGEFITDEIKLIWKQLGPVNFQQLLATMVLMSDLHVNIRSIAHAINLVAQDIVKCDFADHLQYVLYSTFFKPFLIKLSKVRSLI
ncbi:hypothetical protein RCL_jg25589.t1 [Rhizophagus clarus]|uniref:Uncharacterized protein n=1 Tax=Rhizophagus clarus TaxID=94130 RepID=A0A8H3QQX7_9GLOM|nr:hypothetical protein RCL_jg25589.t1 [Rhizophagus clarus]